MKNSSLPPVLRLPVNFDAKKLEADLANVNEAGWQAHFNQAIYDGGWSGAPLRAVPGSHNAIYSGPAADNWQDTELLGRCAYFQAALAGTKSSGCETSLFSALIYAAAAGLSFTFIILGA